ncbi:MAG: NAD(P)-binding domain-containing protein [Deltaproteobacteria bacterium]|nr:NAD(P)-binding domain-containing protein [Deltaproteobacteria bacterium]
MNSSVAILGGGRLAQSVAAILNAAGADVRVWTRRKAARAGLAKKELGTVVETVADACLDAGLVIFAVPAGGFREVAAAFGEVARGDQIVLHATRGVEEGFVLPSRILREETCIRKVGVLGGPLHFKDLTSGRPIAAVMATRYDDAYASVRATVGGQNVHLHRSRDLIGVEVAGLVANISALAVGICDGLGLGDTARGVILTRGLVEASKLGGVLGATRDTFSGLAGVGDLIPRKVSSTHRHHKVGEALAAGQKLEDALGPIRGEVEGILAAQEATRLAGRRGLELPLIHAVDMLVHGEADPRAALDEILQLDLELG